ncbi:DoxX family protein [Brachymonas sp. G13]|uniref:DoxX family protein n=1 Tax=Brachymonas TaxID=28219 RepID=UPI002E785EC4|nr:DoxX family protein [Brachymonas sp. J145]MEE1652752.1 DoxX family protein [Brachymonas sp. J145]
MSQTTAFQTASSSSSTAADSANLIGRLLLAALFLPAGISKLTGFAGTVGYIQSVGMPLPELAAIVGAAVEILGALALIVGFRTRIAALVLGGFTLVASFFFHAYWSAPADAQMVQQLLFNKNIAVVGGLLVLAAAGAGRLSLDARRA